MPPHAPLLITMGDAAGIGPEIVAMAFARGCASGCAVVGDLGVMRRAARLAGTAAVAAIEGPGDVEGAPPGCIPVLQAPGLPRDLATIAFGHIDARAGAAAAACIESAVALTLAGLARGIVTAPIHKEALHAAQVPYPGHTEMLQALATPADEPPPAVRMMLANDELRVVLATIHLPLREAIRRVTFDNVLETIRIAHRASVRWGVPAPRIGVAGLNPHAGEGGLFGDEEMREIAPAVAAARAEGIDATGPHAADTVFMRARSVPGHRGEFDLVVAMTHDHGLIPIKYLGLERGVNATLGLPFVRTSPDHGTAFDLAGSGRANPASLIAAIETARALTEDA